MNKCSGSYSNINDPYAKLCVPNVIKDANVKVFNLISRTTEQDIYNNMKLEDVNMDQMQMFVVTNKGVIKINADVNMKN